MGIPYPSSLKWFRFRFLKSVHLGSKSHNLIVSNHLPQFRQLDFGIYLLTTPDEIGRASGVVKGL